MLVDDLLSDPPQKLIITSPTAFVYEAAEQLSKHRIGLLLVLDAARDVAGVISERDIVAAWGNKLVEVDSARVGDVMTKSVVTVERQSSLTDAASAMKSQISAMSDLNQTSKQLAELAERLRASIAEF